MKLLVLTKSPIFDSILAIFKTEARLLKQKIAVVKPGLKFWEAPDLYCNVAKDEQCWLLVSFSQIGIKKFKGLLSLSQMENLNIFCCESDLKILALLSRLTPQKEQSAPLKTTGDLAALAESLEKSVLKKDTDWKVAFSSLQDLHFKEGNIAYILLESNFRDDLKSKQELADALFYKTRKRSLDGQKKIVIENRINRLKPPFRLISSSKRFDDLLNKQWQDEHPLDTAYPYLTAKPVVQPMILTTLKSCFFSESKYQDWHSLFDKVMTLETELSKNLLSAENFAPEVLLKFKKLSPFEQLSLFESNLTRLKQKQRIKDLAKQEQHILSDRKRFLLGLRNLLAKSQDYHQLTAQDLKTGNILVMSYDDELLREIYHAKHKVQKILWLDLSRISTVDDLAKVDFSKYQRFSQSAVAVTQKRCAGKAGRWLLKMEDSLQAGTKIQLTESSDSKTLAAEHSALQRVLWDFWQPILTSVAADCLSQESKKFKIKISQQLQTEKLQLIAQNITGPTFKVAASPDFLKIITSKVKDKNLDTQDSYLYQLENLAADWQKIKEQLSLRKYQALICQLDLDAEKIAYPVLATLNISVVIFWKGAFKLSLVEKYDRPSWEFFYPKSSAEIKQTLKMLRCEN